MDFLYNTEEYGDAPLMIMTVNTRGIGNVLSSVGGTWKIISATASVIMMPLLLRSFYYSLAEYLIKKEDAKKRLNESEAQTMLDAIKLNLEESVQMKLRASVAEEIDRDREKQERMQ